MLRGVNFESIYSFFLSSEWKQNNNNSSPGFQGPGSLTKTRIFVYTSFPLICSSRPLSTCSPVANHNSFSVFEGKMNFFLSEQLRIYIYIMKKNLKNVNIACLLMNYCINISFSLLFFARNSVLSSKQGGK